MEDRIRLSYFYGKEADQFSFYKIPKLLFTEEYFKKISVEAKVLYGLMLDRMSLSMKNQWMDDEGRAYIYYSLEDIMEALGCSNKKAISIMKELDTDAGIGLIEKKRQGQGKPVLVMRETTERPEALEAGTVKLVGTDYNKIVNEVSSLLVDSIAYEKMSKAVNPYGDGQGCKRIVNRLIKEVAKG